MASVSELASACEGSACIVSALQGLRDVIVDTQTVLLEAALKAGVARFIPSDFSTNFQTLAPGENDLTNLLISLWFCSTKLFQYLHCRSSHS